MYAQNAEDELIWELVENYNPNEVSFIDVGAYDGCTRSNTYLLSRRGWHGILVEPSPNPFQRLHNLYKDNGHLLVNAALGPINSVVSLWPSDDGVSTTIESHYNKWKSTAVYGEQIIVRQISFAGLRQMNKELFDKVQVLSIDTEGSNVNTLETFPFQAARPHVICVEHDNSKHSIKSFLEPIGYKLKSENPENMVFSL